MNNKARKLVAFLLLFSILIGLCACGNSESTVHGDYNSKQELESDALTGNIDVDDGTSSTDDSNNNQNTLALGYQNVNNMSASSPKGEYNKGVVLVKVKDTFKEVDLGELAYTFAAPLYKGSKWYSVTLADSNQTEEAVGYLNELGIFDKVDYDYMMSLTAEMDSVDVSANPDYEQQSYYDIHQIEKGWQQAADNGKKPGGSSDVIIAVIDTGVDYNHIDLRNNIWKNTAEIAGNGKDDDGNGYIDDVYGWDFVSDDNVPMDDNGHGTHVAGIIAAENNTYGGVGVAYNCKIMVIKAGNSSGYFNNSDIAEAIQYAYMNGASVINMSFGGSSISIAVEETLENAYNSCVLVAAAGNESACNDLSCLKCDHVAISYPAALPFVIGVMSVDSDGSTVSSFSNYDHNPYNKIEYEVYAAGENIFSCWPGNKYARLSGTSMSAPIISGLAAVYRSYHQDRDIYSTKYIQSQLVNTGTIHPYYYGTTGKDSAHSVPDIYEALICIPKPAVNFYDYYIDDSVSISSVNNGNGVVDAGETVRLFISLHNRGGVASDVNITIDTNTGGIADPYFALVNPTIQISDIGTYSVRESGEYYFEIVVSEDCPNDYLASLNIHYTYRNGLDDTDTTVYKGGKKLQFSVSQGFYLPASFTKNTVYQADKLYIVGQDVIIPEGITVTFEEGCEIQFYDDRTYYNSPEIAVYGTLNLRGSKNKMIQITPDNGHEEFVCIIKGYGTCTADYVSAINLAISPLKKSSTVTINNSYLRENTNAKTHTVYSYEGGKTITINPVKIFDTGLLHYGTYTIKNSYIESTTDALRLNQIVDSVTNSYLYTKNGNVDYIVGALEFPVSLFSNNIVVIEGDGKNLWGSGEIKTSSAENNYFLSRNNDLEDLVTLNFTEKDRVKNNEFCYIYEQYASQIIVDYYDASGNPSVDVYGSCSNISTLWPYVVSVEIYNSDGEKTTSIGREDITVRVTFNRPMDTTKDTYLTFGTIEPYADYRIDGEYLSNTVWEGTYTLKAQIENGQNFLKVNNACAADDKTKMVFGEYQLYEFTIDTTEAISMNLQAQALDSGIELTWAQDDYDTLMGYNIYRADSEDGNYVRLNPAILLSTDESFLDDNVEPGKRYWYTFTVVLSDFGESTPAGKVMATAKDTMAPSLYHTPVNQGYENNNLVISCTASDNVAITNVTLYYRSIGESTWKMLTMSRQNNKYSATIFGYEVTLVGVEYYIIATDGINQVAKGTADVPYMVVVKSADSLTGIGDVDGDGAITTKDALMLMQAINDDIILTDDQFKRADLNGDNILYSSEALRILQYINGNVNTLEM